MWYTGKNNLRILLDPATIHFDKQEDFSRLVAETVRLKIVLDYFNRISTPIKTEFFYPKFLKRPQWRTNEHVLIPEGTTILEKEQAKEKGRDIGATEYIINLREKYLKPIPKKPSALLDLIKDGSIYELRDAIYLYKHNGHELLDIYKQLQCDYLISSNRVFQKEKKKLREKYKIFIVNFYEFLSELEIFAKGNNVYIDILKPPFGTPGYGYDIGTFYPMTDPKFRRYSNLWIAIQKIKKDQKIDEYFRVAIYHRHSFMRYAMDQIKFNIQQADRFNLRDRYRGQHHFLVSYHLNSFYFMLWGFLDNLAWIFNYLFEFGFKETDESRNKCTFISKDFERKIKIKAPAIWQLITNPKYQKWFDNLAIKRHPAAHREPIFLTQLVRSKDFSMISDRLVIGKNKSGTYLFDAINHMEFDWRTLCEFMDELCKIFKV